MASELLVLLKGGESFAQEISSFIKSFHYLNLKFEQRVI